MRDVLWDVSLNGLAPEVASFGRNGDTADSSGSLRVGPGRHAASVRLRRAVAAGPHRARGARGLADADILMLDTPRRVTVEMAELSRRVDAVILVVRQGRVSRRSLRALARQTKGWKAKITGAVLTDAPQEERHSYYYRA